MSSIAVAQAAMAYQPAYQRSGCKDCAHVLIETGPFPSGSGNFWCSKGQFYGTALSICKHHEVKPIEPNQQEKKS